MAAREPSRGPSWGGHLHLVRRWWRLQPANAAAGRRQLLRGARSAGGGDCGRWLLGNQQEQQAAWAAYYQAQGQYGQYGGYGQYGQGYGQGYGQYGQ